MDTIDIVLEVFTWVGLGGAAVLAVIALALRGADGVWRPVRAVLDDSERGRVARWFGDGSAVGEALLTPEQEHALRGRDTADVFVRAGSTDRMRLAAGSPAVRTVAWSAVGLAVLGVVAVAASLVLLVVHG